MSDQEVAGENPVVGGEDKQLKSEGPKKESIKFKTVTEIEMERFGYYEYDYDRNVILPLALDLKNMELTDIYPISIYPFLNFLRLSNNKLTNASLEDLKYLPDLVSLYLENNLITSTTLVRLERLQQLNFENNPIKVIDPIDQPHLQILIMNNTKISQLQYLGIHSVPRLETFSAIYCKITNMISDYALTLKHLFLGYNDIKRLEGLENLIQLKTLHLRQNRVSSLMGLTVGLEKLEYLNLRNNEVSDMEEVKRIRCLPKLQVIILTDNPVDDEMGSDIRPMVLMYSLGLKRINKALTDEEEVKFARSLIYEVEEEAERVNAEEDDFANA